MSLFTKWFSNYFFNCATREYSFTSNFPSNIITSFESVQCWCTLCISSTRLEVDEYIWNVNPYALDYGRFRQCWTKLFSAFLKEGQRELISLIQLTKAMTVLALSILRLNNTLKCKFYTSKFGRFLKKKVKKDIHRYFWKYWMKYKNSGAYLVCRWLRGVKTQSVTGSSG